MPSPPDLPALRTRDAYALGVGRRELSGPRWRHPYRGVAVPAGSVPTSPMQRVYDAAALLPAEAAIGGWAAALLHGATDIEGRSPGGTSDDLVLLVVPPPVQMRRRPGIRILYSDLGTDDVAVVRGLRVTTPLRTAFDLARTGSLQEAVVALDSLGRELRVGSEHVVQYAAGRRRWKGTPRVRQAAALSDPRSASPGEPRLRLLWMLDAGLPRPQCNVDVVRPTGELIGIADLLDPDAALVGEYDGAQHRTLAQHTLDNAREEWLEEAGLVVVRATAVDLRREQRLRTVHRLQAACRQRDRSRDRWAVRSRR